MVAMLQDVKDGWPLLGPQICLKTLWKSYLDLELSGTDDTSSLLPFGDRQKGSFPPGKSSHRNSFKDCDFEVLQ